MSSVTVTKDVWKKIPGMPPRYEAAPDGRVRILPYELEETRKINGVIRRITRRVPGRMVKPYLTGRKLTAGHRQWAISTGKGEARLNMLVARAFLGCPYDIDDVREKNKWRVRHLDGDTLNCAADNLEWVMKGSVDDFAAGNANRDAWLESCKEPVESWLLKFYSPDEIDWDKSQWVDAA
jgi:hypothetical protein